MKRPTNASEQLLAQLDEVLKRWEHQANIEILAALHLESLTLRNHLPGLLKQIARALDETPESPVGCEKTDRKISEEHGANRANLTDYSLSQMIHEYHLLRRVICDVMEEHDMGSHRTYEVISSSIEQAIKYAVIEFTNVEKRRQEVLTCALTHDLRTPITAAQLSAERIRKSSDNPDRCATGAERILKSLGRLTAMLDDLLEDKRNAMTEDAAAQRPDMLTQTLQQAIAENNLLYGDRFRLTLHSDFYGTWTPQDLRRVLDNLLSNAAKYGAPDTIIDVQGGQYGEKTYLSVFNRGSFVTDAEKEKLFLPFQRAQAALPKMGWGVGLASVKLIMDSYAGDILVDSSKEKGTRFTVSLKS